MFYQIGVLLSRSSIRYIRIKNLEIITILQGFNVVIWSYIALEQGIDMKLMAVLMIWVGLLGGTVYANALYSIMTDENILLHEKEVCVNILNIFNFVGIFSGSLISMILEEYIF
jgi:battenin